jgi:diguanylate cyclase (GGDEF)-like protein
METESTISHSLKEAMEPLNVFVISSKAGIAKKVRGALKLAREDGVPQFEVKHQTDLDQAKAELEQGPCQVILLDLDSMGLDPAQMDQDLSTLRQDRILVLLSEEPSLSGILPGQEDIYSINSSDLDSPLFIPFLRSLASQTFLIRSNHSSRQDLKSRLNELHLLRKASLHLTMNLSLDAVLEAILQSALELVSAEDSHIFLYDHGVLSFGAALFEGHQQRSPIMNPRPHGMTYQVAREGKLIVVNDTMTDPLFEDRRWKGSIIGIPLKIGNKVLGVMNVALQRAHTFTDNEIQVLEFLGDQASIAIQNAKLYEQAQQEIADRKRAEKAIQHLANHDALTGLPNRRLFNERIILEISRAQRNKQKIGVMLFDLDQLKNVNDTYGHNVGDMLLQAVAQRLLGLLRKSDTIARMGGDEFILILPEMQHQADAIQTAERILDALSTPFHLETYQVNITTSIGVAFYPDDGGEPESLTKKADIAMYKAKEKGGNTYHLFTA